MLATIQSRTFCLLVCCLKTEELEYTKLLFCLWYCMGAKLGLLTLREEHRLKEFENRMLRTIFGPRKDEVTGDWRQLHNEELHNLYSSPSIIRMMGRACKQRGETRNAYKILVAKPEGRRPLGRPRYT
jgi:hypothetical protein